MPGLYELFKSFRAVWEKIGISLILKEMRKIGLISCISVGVWVSSALPGRASVSIKKHTDYKTIKTTALLAVPDAKGLKDSGSLVTAMLREHLEESGLVLVDPEAQKKHLKEKGMGMGIHSSRELIQAMGESLGADAVVIGRLVVDIEDQEVGSMAGRQKIIVRRNGRFVQVEKKAELGPGKVQYFDVDGPVRVNVTIKMVRVKNGEILWLLSEEKRTRGFQKALRAALDPSMARVKRVIGKSLEGYTFKPKKREKWRGLDRQWDRRHQRGRH